ncbi:MAG: Lar family restriction alleviation protein [Actinomycetota bacterium]
MVNELKSCPFCGSANTGFGGDFDLQWANCRECSAEGPVADTRAGAMRLWSTRAFTAENERLRAALRAVLPAVSDEAERREASDEPEYIAEMRDAEAAICAALGEGE